MNRKFGLVLLYLTITLVLSSVDITYEWFSPLSSEAGEKIDWYAVSGLRAGTLILGNHDTGPAMGLSSKLHLPQLPMLPYLCHWRPRRWCYLCRCLAGRWHYLPDSRIEVFSNQVSICMVIIELCPTTRSTGRALRRAG